MTRSPATIRNSNATPVYASGAPARPVPATYSAEQAPEKSRRPHPAEPFATPTPQRRINSKWAARLGIMGIALALATGAAWLTALVFWLWRSQIG